jgi:hypothetical protein
LIGFIGPTEVVPFYKPSKSRLERVFPQPVKSCPFTKLSKSAREAGFSAACEVVLFYKALEIGPGSGFFRSLRSRALFTKLSKSAWEASFSAASEVVPFNKTFEISWPFADPILPVGKSLHNRALRKGV